MKHPKAVAPQRPIKVGGLYFDKARGANVTAEDHEIQDGRRTGRILVCAADAKLHFPRRWYSRDADLGEPQDEVPLLPADDGASP